MRKKNIAVGQFDLKLIPTAIQGVMIAENSIFEDSRGAFSRLFCEIELAPVLADRKIVQINQSMTHQVGAVRGLHYQHQPNAEMKMIRCIKGKVWDVAVDLRRGSSTFLHWVGQELTEGKSEMMIIPEGCAHGFQVLDVDSQLLYLHTASYTPETEGAIRYDDPLIAIDWPVNVTDLSQRDQSQSLLLNTFQGLDL